MRPFFALMLTCLPVVAADDAPAPRKLKDVPATEVNIRKAVEQSLPQLWAGLEGHNAVHTCFACHHHGAALVAFGIARTRGYDVPEKKLQEQIEFLAADVERNRKNYESGKGPGPSPAGGQTDNTGYQLLALAAIGHRPDASTAAVVSYTLGHQKGRDAWTAVGSRPPTEASGFTTTALNIRGIRVFQTKEQTEAADQRIAAAKGWLVKTPAKDTEDRVFRLIGLKAAGAGAEELKKATEELRESQREDGGWGQLDTMESDPYATATALFALHTAGGVAVA